MKKFIAFAIAAILVVLMLSGTPGLSDNVPEIDWDKARQLLDRRNAGRQLTPAEQDYLAKAIQARTAGASGPNAGHGPSAETAAKTGGPLSALNEELRLPAKAPPTDYKAAHDFDARELPPLPKPGPAGSAITDPVFGSRILRVTQPDTIAEPANESFYTTSSSWQNTWNANSTLFYVMAQSGFYIPFKFDPVTLTAARIKDTSHPGEALVLQFRRDPNFSYRNPAILYGVSKDLQLMEYDFALNAYKPLLDLKTLVNRLDGNDTDGVSSSENDELVVAFNGPGQDRLMNVVWFDRNSGKRHLLDLSNGTIDGKSAHFPLGKGGAHHASIAKGGRYVNVINQGVGNIVWDTETGTCTLIAGQSGAHGAGGYACWINFDTLPDHSSQGWLYRTMDPDGLTRPKPLIPRMPRLWGDSHPSWNNAQPARTVPFFTALYNQDYKPGDTALAPLMGEIVAVSSDGSGRVWRFAHHRSVINSGGSLGRSKDFWSTPRGNVSQDGRYFLFDSNWEDSLGKDPRGGFRKDVFVVECK